jgi:hypothetical protein
MFVTATVDRITAECPSFQQVDHSLTSSAQNAYPAAFVAPLRSVAEAANFQPVMSQMATHTVSVYVVLERKQDATISTSLDDLRLELRAALRGWAPAGSQFEFQYDGGQLDMRDGIACWREDFTIQEELRL